MTIPIKTNIQSSSNCGNIALFLLKIICVPSNNSQHKLLAKKQICASKLIVRVFLVINTRNNCGKLQTIIMIVNNVPRICSHNIIGLSIFVIN